MSTKDKSEKFKYLPEGKPLERRAMVKMEFGNGQMAVNLHKVAKGIYGLNESARFESSNNQHWHTIDDSLYAKAKENYDELIRIFSGQPRVYKLSSTRNRVWYLHDLELQGTTEEEVLRQQQEQAKLALKQRGGSMRGSFVGKLGSLSREGSRRGSFRSSLLQTSSNAEEFEGEEEGKEAKKIEDGVKSTRGKLKRNLQGVLISDDPKHSYLNPLDVPLPWVMKKGVKGNVYYMNDVTGEISDAPPGQIWEQKYSLVQKIKQDEDTKEYYYVESLEEKNNRISLIESFYNRMEEEVHRRQYFPTEIEQIEDVLYKVVDLVHRRLEREDLMAKLALKKHVRESWHPCTDGYRMSKLGYDVTSAGEKVLRISDVDVCDILITKYGGMFAKTVPPGLFLKFAEEREVKRLARLEELEEEKEARRALAEGDGATFGENLRLIFAIGRNDPSEALRQFIFRLKSGVLRVPRKISYVLEPYMDRDLLYKKSRHILNYGTKSLMFSARNPRKVYKILKKKLTTLYDFMTIADKKVREEKRLAAKIEREQLYAEEGDGETASLSDDTSFPSFKSLEIPEPLTPEQEQLLRLRAEESAEEAEAALLSIQKKRPVVRERKPISRCDTVCITLTMLLEVPPMVIKRPKLTKMEKLQNKLKENERLNRIVEDAKVWSRDLKRVFNKYLFLDSDELDDIGENTGQKEALPEGKPSTVKKMHSKFDDLKVNWLSANPPQFSTDRFKQSYYYEPAYYNRAAKKILKDDNRKVEETSDNLEQGIDSNLPHSISKFKNVNELKSLTAGLSLASEIISGKVADFFSDPDDPISSSDDDDDDEDDDDSESEESVKKTKKAVREPPLKDILDSSLRKAFEQQLLQEIGVASCIPSKYFSIEEVRILPHNDHNLVNAFARNIAIINELEEAQGFVRHISEERKPLNNSTVIVKESAMVSLEGSGNVEGAESSDFTGNNDNLGTDIVNLPVEPQISPIKITNLGTINMKDVNELFGLGENVNLDFVSKKIDRLEALQRQVLNDPTEQNLLELKTHISKEIYVWKNFVEDLGAEELAEKLDIYLGKVRSYLSSKFGRTLPLVSTPVKPSRHNSDHVSDNLVPSRVEPVLDIVQSEHSVARSIASGTLENNESNEIVSLVENSKDSSVRDEIIVHPQDLLQLATGVICAEASEASSINLVAGNALAIALKTTKSTKSSVMSRRSLYSGNAVKIGNTADLMRIGIRGLSELEKQHRRVRLLQRFVFIKQLPEADSFIQEELEKWHEDSEKYVKPFVHKVIFPMNNEIIRLKERVIKPGLEATMGKISPFMLQAQKSILRAVLGAPPVSPVKPKRIDKQKLCEDRLRKSRSQHSVDVLAPYLAKANAKKQAAIDNSLEQEALEQEALEQEAGEGNENEEEKDEEDGSAAELRMLKFQHDLEEQEWENYYSLQYLSYLEKYPDEIVELASQLCLAAEIKAIEDEEMERTKRLLTGNNSEDEDSEALAAEKESRVPGIRGFILSQLRLKQEKFYRSLRHDADIAKAKKISGYLPIIPNQFEYTIVTENDELKVFTLGSPNKTLEMALKPDTPPAKRIELPVLESEVVEGEEDDEGKSVHVAEEPPKVDAYPNLVGCEVSVMVYVDENLKEMMLSKANLDSLEAEDIAIMLRQQIFDPKSLLHKGELTRKTIDLKYRHISKAKEYSSWSDFWVHCIHPAFFNYQSKKKAKNLTLDVILKQRYANDPRLPSGILKYEPVEHFEPNILDTFKRLADHDQKIKDAIAKAQVNVNSLYEEDFVEEVKPPSVLEEEAQALLRKEDEVLTYYHPDLDNLTELDVSKTRRIASLYERKYQSEMDLGLIDGKSMRRSQFSALKERDAAFRIYRITKNKFDFNQRQMKTLSAQATYTKVTDDLIKKWADELRAEENNRLIKEREDREHRTLQHKQEGIIVRRAKNWKTWIFEAMIVRSPHPDPLREALEPEFKLYENFFAKVKENITNEADKKYFEALVANRELRITEERQSRLLFDKANQFFLDMGNKSRDLLPQFALLSTVGENYEEPASIRDCLLPVMKKQYFLAYLKLLHLCVVNEKRLEEEERKRTKEAMLEARKAKLRATMKTDHDKLHKKDALAFGFAETDVEVFQRTIERLVPEICHIFNGINCDMFTFMMYYVKSNQKEQLNDLSLFKSLQWVEFAFGNPDVWYCLENFPSYSLNMFVREEVAQFAQTILEVQFTYLKAKLVVLKAEEQAALARQRMELLASKKGKIKGAVQVLAANLAMVKLKNGPTSPKEVLDPQLRLGSSDQNELLVKSETENVDIEVNLIEGENDDGGNEKETTAVLSVEEELLKLKADKEAFDLKKQIEFNETKEKRERDRILSHTHLYIQAPGMTAPYCVVCTQRKFEYWHFKAKEAEAVWREGFKEQVATVREAGRFVLEEFLSKCNENMVGIKQLIITTELSKPHMNKDVIQSVYGTVASVFVRQELSRVRVSPLWNDNLELALSFELKKEKLENIQDIGDNYTKKFWDENDANLIPVNCPKFCDKRTSNLIRNIQSYRGVKSVLNFNTGISTIHNPVVGIRDRYGEIKNLAVPEHLIHCGIPAVDPRGKDIVVSEIKSAIKVEQDIVKNEKLRRKNNIKNNNSDDIIEGEIVKEANSDDEAEEIMNNKVVLINEDPYPEILVKVYSRATDDSGTKHSKGPLLGVALFTSEELLNIDTPQGIRRKNMKQKHIPLCFGENDNSTVSGFLSLKLTFPKVDKENKVPILWKLELVKGNKLAVVKKEPFTHPFCEIYWRGLVQTTRFVVNKRDGLSRKLSVRASSRKNISRRTLSIGPAISNDTAGDLALSPSTDLIVPKSSKSSREDEKAKKKKQYLELPYYDPQLLTSEEEGVMHLFKDFVLCGHISAQEATISPVWSKEEGTFVFPPVWTMNPIVGRNLDDTPVIGGWVGRNSDLVLCEDTGVRKISESADLYEDMDYFEFNKRAEELKKAEELSKKESDIIIAKTDAHLLRRLHILSALQRAEETERKNMHDEEEQTRKFLVESEINKYRPYIDQQKVFAREYQYVLQNIKEPPNTLARLKFMMGVDSGAGNISAMCLDPSNNLITDVVMVPLLYPEDEQRMAYDLSLLIGKYHPNVVKVVDFSIHFMRGFTATGFTFADCRMGIVVLERSLGLPMMDYLKENWASVNNNDFRLLLLQIAQALQYLHTQGDGTCCHRNFHADCCRVSLIRQAPTRFKKHLTFDNKPVVKIGDFWFLHNPRNVGCEFSSGRADWGNRTTLPPEAMNAIRGASVTDKSDIYAFGLCVLYWATKGTYTSLPKVNGVQASAYNYVNAVDNLKSCLPLRWGEWVLVFLKMCLNPNPINRASANELIKFLSVRVKN